MLENMINYMAYGSLIFTAVAAYLQLNKLWVRKHLPDVADSISLTGIAVESIPLFFFGLYFLSKQEWVGIIDSVVWLISCVLFVMIGSGFWVKERRGQNFLSRMMASLRRERSEVSRLAMHIFSDTTAPELAGVLSAMAMVDGKLDDKELNLLKPFLKQWGLKVSDVTDYSSEGDSNNVRLIKVSKAMEAYINTSPSTEQVAHLQDLLLLLINIDDKVTREEKMAFDELSGVIQDYIGSDAEAAAQHSVIIAPQNEQQGEAVKVLLNQVQPQSYAGGDAFLVGAFHTAEYADIICKEYRALGFFTVVLNRQ